ncbi:MAG: T9SS type A sorting domain-containing protein, partial [Ignavibacteriales bacterium]|nr:T9SS type A sorting domain-containing protein [Ignavibacteriales bacterium]
MTRTLFLFGFLALAAALRPQSEAPRLSYFEITYRDTTGPYLIDVFTAPDTSENGFGNTGLAYERFGGFLYSSAYNYAVSSRIVAVNKNGTRRGRVIDVSDRLYHIQGLASDQSDTTLWVWGALNADLTGDRIILHIDTTGATIDSILTSLKGGTMCYNYLRDELWVKPFAGAPTIVAVYDCATLTPTRTFDAGVSGEGIAFDPFDTTYWALDERALWHKELQGATIESYDNPSHYYPGDPTPVAGAAEGLALDLSDRTLWFNADQYIHGAVPGGNRVWHVDPLNTYGEFVNFPFGIPWRAGSLEGLIVEDDRLVGEGRYITPVIDFGEEPPLDLVAHVKEGAWEVAYRGADDPPTTAPDTTQPLDYYPANQATLGWGDVDPSAWTSEPPAMRYLQLRVTLAAEAAFADRDETPGEFSLSQNYPNPFNPATTVRYALPEAATVRLTIYNALGEVVRELESSFKQAGYHEATFNASDLGSGVYFYRIDA